MRRTSLPARNDSHRKPRLSVAARTEKLSRRAELAIRSAAGGALIATVAFAGMACGRAESRASTATAGARPGAEAPSRRSSSGRVDVAGLLTKEEVSAVFGVPVTALASSGNSSVTYKTADPMMEATLEVDRKHGTADAVAAMDGARKATKLLGGTPQAAAGLGDDAFFGAMSMLYVRSGDVVMTVVPPNLLQVAQGKAYNKVVSAGSPEATRKAMEDLAAMTNGSPLQAGNAERDPMKGATDTIAASSRPQGTEYEAKTRIMASEIARRALTRL